MAANIPPSSITFNEMEFTFPSNATLHSINEEQTILSYLIIESEESILFSEESYQIHIIRLKPHTPKHVRSEKLSFKPMTLQFITINQSKHKKANYILIIGDANGSLHAMDIECALFFTQRISDTAIHSIALHFDSLFYSFCPSLILNCQSFLLFIACDEVYRTLTLSQSNTVTVTDLDSAIASLMKPKKILLTKVPKQMTDIVSIAPIDLLKHGINSSLLSPEPRLNLYSNHSLSLLIIGSDPCLTYVTIDKSSKGFGVREIKNGANKLVKSAFNLVTQSISNPFTVFGSFWDAQENISENNSENESVSENALNLRNAAEESIRKMEGIRYKIQCIFEDKNRKIESIILSPVRRYAALMDSFGRISILDCQTLAILRMFKGCRGAQCAWIQMEGSMLEKERSLSATNSFSLPWTVPSTLLLIIYIAPRGILEIYHLSIKHRLGALRFSANGLLLYHLTLSEVYRFSVRCDHDKYTFSCPFPNFYLIKTHFFLPLSQFLPHQNALFLKMLKSFTLCDRISVTQSLALVLFRTTAIKSVPK